MAQNWNAGEKEKGPGSIGNSQAIQSGRVSHPPIDERVRTRTDVRRRTRAHAHLLNTSTRSIASNDIALLERKIKGDVPSHINQRPGGRGGVRAARGRPTSRPGGRYSFIAIGMLARPRPPGPTFAASDADKKSDVPA
ncbi:hypothetical protein EVAR_8131_1 [Eumeta japonica]|uniref:Uncharacterized protein n=1 Tax=Eumeta variegata TaxID=151549 RepID=A0A4C1TSS2_EUMVA|nr:hypothetical protein EVAR_8131_1 [Eumeta japonica]